MNKILFLGFFLFITLVHAQNSGSLSGRILDLQSQQPLPGATLILEGTGIGVVTDEEGYFTIN